jgi:hypothetical protein
VPASIERASCSRNGGDGVCPRCRAAAGRPRSFSTWLEDEGIPARVIDELIGHQRSRHGELEGGSRIGARYRHTTPEMADRVIHALDRRLTLALHVAEAITPAERDRSAWVF